MLWGRLSAQGRRGRSEMTDFEEDDFGSGGCSEKVTVLIALYATRSAEHTFFFWEGGKPS